MPDDRRRLLLRAGLGFLQLEPRAAELRLLHRWLDTWTGLGLIVVGVERRGLRFSLSHIADGEWRAYFMSSPMLAPAGFGVATDAVAGGAAGGVGLCHRKRQLLDAAQTSRLNEQISAASLRIADVTDAVVGRRRPHRLLALRP